MMNNLRRCVIPTLRNGSNALRQHTAAAAAAAAVSWSSAATQHQPLRRPVAGTNFYHTTSLARQQPTDDSNNNNNSVSSSLRVLLTDDMIAAMEYHHEKHDMTDLNMFLKHPSSPKTMAWHPDLVFDGDAVIDEILVVNNNNNNDLENQEASMTMEEEVEEENQVQAMHVSKKLVRRWRKPTLSFMNRNARYAKKANHGKKPCSRQRRRKKKRAIGNGRRI